MTYHDVVTRGTELASVEHGDLLRTVRAIYLCDGIYYQTEREEEGITGEDYPGQIVATATTLEGLLEVGDPNVIEDLVSAANERELASDEVRSQ